MAASAIILGDIGGTNTRLAVFDQNRFLCEANYATQHYKSFIEILNDFFKQATTFSPKSASFAIAGVIKNNKSESINIPWQIDAHLVACKFNLPNTTLLNDFEAVAHGINLLSQDDLVQIGGSKKPALNGNKAILGAGTGLGEAFLIWNAKNQNYLVVSTEGGHKDFSPTDGIQMELLAFLIERYEHVSIERILSGRGIEDIYAFLSSKQGDGSTTKLIASLITEHAISGEDKIAYDVVQLFCKIIGAEAGNMALQVLATSGVYIAGGIAPRILNFLKTGEARKSFEAKGRFRTLLQDIPLYVVINPKVGMLGAFSYWKQVNCGLAQ